MAFTVKGSPDVILLVWQ